MSQAFNKTTIVCGRAKHSQGQKAVKNLENVTG